MMKRVLIGSVLILALGAVAWALSDQRHKKFDSFEHEVRQISFWQKYKFNERAIEDRIFDIPDELLDYLTQDNMSQGWPNRPMAFSLSAEKQQMLKEALRELPEPVKTKASPLLAGIFFVKDLGGTAYTESIIDEAGNPVAGFMVLDELILNKKANEWASWKEKSPFMLDKNWDLEMTIEENADDTVKAAFQFIVLHELGHIASIKSDMHPPWGYPISADQHPSKFAFSKLSWTLDGDKTISLFDTVFPLRNQLHFYKGDSQANLMDIYSQLEKTNFPTLYSATNLSDDFADSFAAFVHVVLMKRPYRVVILKDGQLVKTIPTCWGLNRCLEKEIVLRSFLGVQ
jgi:hypothetical protein